MIGEQPPPGIGPIYDRVGQSFLAGQVTDVGRALRELDEFWSDAQGN